MGIYRMLIMKFMIFTIKLISWPDDFIYALNWAQLIVPPWYGK